ncbi:MAG: aldo/keto reductase [Pseudomonadota bacterium]
MKTRWLAGRQVGAIGLGCMSFGGMYGGSDEETSRACLARAVEQGIDHWDVAEIYGAGECEAIIGRFLADHPVDVSIATKAGIYPDKDRPWRNDADSLRASLEGSLTRLGQSSVALFYVHRRDPAISIETVMETLLGFQTEGLIGAIGFSEIAPASLRRAAKLGPVAAVQSEYSLWTRQPELGMLRACADLGAAFVAFSPVGRGMLSDCVPEPAGFAERDIRQRMPRFQAPAFEANAAAIAPFRAWCGERGWATAAVAMAWLLAQAPHVLPIPGTRSATHLDELAAGAAIDLSADDLDQIDVLLPPGFAEGDRYTPAQYGAVERYC